MSKVRQSSTCWCFGEGKQKTHEDTAARTAATTSRHATVVMLLSMVQCSSNTAQRQHTCLNSQSVITSFS